MLSQLTREQKPDGSLNLPGGDGRSLVVVSQAGGFSGDALENVVHKAVHDRHGLAGNSGIGMNLLQNFVDVNGIALLPLLLTIFLVSLGDVFRRLSSLLDGFTAGFGCHSAERDAF